VILTSGINVFVEIGSQIWEECQAFMQQQGVERPAPDSPAI
jgi:hypothetical protein